MATIKDAFSIGSKCTIVHDADLRGDITIGSGSVLHPRCSIVAYSGPIVIGSNCIIEETVIIVNRTKGVMRIGDNNHFQVGCRIESPQIGHSNIFNPRCRTSPLITIGDHCSIGAGCIVLPNPFPPPFSAPPPGEEEEKEGATPMQEEPAAAAAEEGDEADRDPSSPRPPSLPPKDPPLSTPAPLPAPTTMHIPSHSTLFLSSTASSPSDIRTRVWSGEGSGQGKAFHLKHLEYLREMVPRGNKLRMFV
ncbi:trimeric LpxA-like protein [Leucosporidium creatinivorum]|uniref:Dynactin subunit 6 n=1 Tax=Leucosporidium creatinivorum TaxID=106004 RepID=A0A1Y2G4U9_9BASI|nr:trimeric LpxA-like protein [Leucosporidium creatinivorum]